MILWVYFSLFFVVALNKAKSKPFLRNEVDVTGTVPSLSVQTLRCDLDFQGAADPRPLVDLGTEHA